MSQVNNSIVRQFAFKTLDCFDDLARPEIKNRVIGKIWNYMKNYTSKIIMRKSDEELKLKLFKIYSTLGPLFNETEMSIQMQEGEKLGSIPVPNVGRMGQIKQLVKIDEKKAFELLEELKFV